MVVPKVVQVRAMIRVQSTANIASAEEEGDFAILHGFAEPSEIGVRGTSSKGPRCSTVYLQALITMGPTITISLPPHHHGSIFFFTLHCHLSLQQHCFWGWW